jgi:hypothetical protein
VVSLAGVAKYIITLIRALVALTFIEGIDLPIRPHVHSRFSNTLARETESYPRALQLSPDQFAPHVKAKDGAEIISYEDDTGELPVRMLIRYARLVDLPLDNPVDDDRDLWFGASRELRNL